MTLLSLFNLEASIETQGRSGARNRKFRSSNVSVWPGELDAKANLLGRATAVTNPAPKVSPSRPVSTNAQMAWARPWLNASGRLENSISPRIARTRLVTNNPNTTSPTNPVTTVNSGDLPRILARPPTQPARTKANKINISASAHLRLVVGRREIDQHFNTPANNASQTIN